MGEVGIGNIGQMGFLAIIKESLRQTFANIKLFFKCLFPPTFGQIVGLVVALSPVFIFSGLAGTNVLLYLLLVLAGSIVGIVIFCIYFWKYLLAYAALVSISERLISNDMVADIRGHIDAIKQRSGPYIVLLLILCAVQIVISAIGYKSSLSGTVLGCLMLYMVLSMQTFVLGNEDPKEAILTSIKMIKGNFWRTFWLSILGGIATIILIMPIYIAFIIVALTMLKGIIIPGLSMPDTSAIMGASIVLIIVSVFMSIYLVPFNTMIYTHWYLKLKSAKSIEYTEDENTNPQ